MVAVSVIVPTYNRYKLLYFCLLSILSQSFDDFEIIVVDNSDLPITDRILKLVSSNHITYAKVGKIGCFASINRGVKMAKGELLLVLADDHICGRDYIKRLVSLWRSTKNCGAVCGRIIYVKENKICNPKTKPFPAKIDSVTGDIIGDFDVLTKGAVKVPMVHGSALFSRSDFDRVGGFDERYDPGGFRGETDFFLRIRSLQKNFYYDPHAVFYHIATKSGGYRRIIIKYELNALRKHWYFLRKHYPQNKNLRMLLFVLRRMYVRVFQFAIAVLRKHGLLQRNRQPFALNGLIRLKV